MNVEEQAMDIAKKFEKKRTKKYPEDVHKKGLGYDLKSSDRLIEVKGQSKDKAGWFWLYKTLFKKLGKDISKYHIYVVYGLNKDKRKSKPKVKLLKPELIFRSIEIDPRFVISEKNVSNGEDIKV